MLRGKGRSCDGRRRVAPRRPENFRRPAGKR
uniref:Uncharacterized protein n=1 Tax=Rhizophora mucronata TaxID=61149 RepID=A0A2P2NP20_RHIMU